MTASIRMVGTQRKRQEVTQSDKDIVVELHDVIQSAIGRDRYEVWFRGQVTFEFASDSGTLEVRLPDEFSLEQVRRRFSVTIQEACARLLSSPIHLQWKAVPHVKSSSSDARPDHAPLSSGMAPELHSNHACSNNTQSNHAPPLETPQASGRGEAKMRVIGADASIDQGQSLADGSFKSTSTEFSSSLLVETRRTSRGHQTPPATTSSAPIPAKASSASQRRGEFETFISGEQSTLALSAAKHTVQNLGEISPLFLYGPTGVGKTHLLQAIYSAVRRRSRARCVLLSAEQFTSSFLEALRGHGLPSFRRKYRHIDLLLLDDIQFFVGKRATLVELLYTLDALVQDGHQVVLAADRPPNELRGVGTEIIARLSAGLICGLEYPEGDAKVELVQRLAQERSIPLPPEVANLLASELPGDARRIKGAVNRLSVIARAMGEPPTVDRARRELADLFQANQRPLAIPDIERAVCEVFGVDGKLLRSDRKTKTISQPRMLAMWLARKHTRAAFSEIGDYFGGRSHSTVISAHHKVERWVGSNSDIQVASGESKVVDAIRRIEVNLRAM